MKRAITPPSLWFRQFPHLIAMVVLSLLCFLAWQQLGAPQEEIFWLSVLIPIVHQLFVWFCWRSELNNQLITRTIGFKAYVILFFVMFAGRFISLIWLGFVDMGSLKLPSMWQTVLGVGMLILGGYAMYSVKRYFGMIRATGADHFDPQYREMALVDKGIFRYTNNGMYLYAFLLFWCIAIAFNSQSALLAAAFSHAAIWLHYYFVEKPDMDFIYRQQE